ncbi:HIT family hydrolase [Brevundimonas sp. EAKA]|jgi:histidine triad (HIT) family protein|uniref:HIT family protein n=1 Tax=Brevundimonas mediterranea TaxID=74329 RepID=A0A6G7EE28_9CAUL|nr:MULTISPECIES: HIT family protein [Brevundimonas]MBU4197109.1 HIT family protein [Alphaproteobacteria bacterium]OGN46939.1 MAG: HIT family hydrolase [Caulobacterales bacterium GWE1_67_11]OGN48193.1 MAG: HIT family hydrolase [Caulobacterales bacterium RIFCSPHIGHO2_12_FULL_68_13]OGN60037.1 MAG: HIT family hydrolase [Caulobacterales bacterium RIFOXYA1_FULL_67_7]EDX81817.1 histidine triad domain protein [Brevundimonas sp. BAL3]
MSLHGEYDPDNIFAKILRGEIPSVKVWEDDHVLAFMDVFPQSEGHVLIIAKQSQARNLLEVEPDILARLTAALQRTAVAVERALKPDGIAVMQFNGDAGGQTVFHLHFHIIPRWADRPMKGHGHAPMAEAAALRPLADRIAAELA